MNLQSGYPLSLISHGLPYQYPKLNSSIKTDVVIVGGGISGALSAHYLVKAGFDCVLVDGRTIGLGSTCASTSLLQYEIDVPLSKLIEKIGERDAIRAYTLCKEAIDKLAKLAKEISFKNFEYKDSLYFAASKKDLPFLKDEFVAREKLGFDIQYLDQRKVSDKYAFEGLGAILSRHGAQANAYLLTHALLQYDIKKGLKVYDRTYITDIDHTNTGAVLKTENGFTLKAKKIIYATGYEVTEFINKKIVTLTSTYATASENLLHSSRNLVDDTLFWNTAQPYLYMRSTKDGRIIIGGRDEKFHNPTKRDELIESKSKLLTKDFIKLFPEIPFKSEFSWAGTFGSTADGLPFIGKYAKKKHGYFALGFGGNGITFSLIAAEIITDMLLERKHEDAKLFSFDRL